MLALSHEFKTQKQKTKKNLKTFRLVVDIPPADLRTRQG
jgi:hypothetical protein